MLRALRFMAGAAVAVAIWWYMTPAYNALLARSVAFRYPIAAAAGRAIRVTPPNGPRTEVPADQLTYNVILFAGLIAAAPPKWWRALLGLIVVLGFHVIALLVTIENGYATRAGEWSNAHYSPLQQDFWNSAEFIYRIGGMFAIAFLCWYVALQSRAPVAGRPASRSAKRPRVNR